MLSRVQAVVNQNRAALLAATGQGSASLDQARSANAALAKQDVASLADDSGAPQALQARKLRLRHWLLHVQDVCSAACAAGLYGRSIHAEI